MGKSEDIRNARLFDQVCDDFEESWCEAFRPDFERYLGEVDELERTELLQRLLEVDVELRGKKGQKVEPQQYQHLSDQAVVIVRHLLDSESCTKSIDSHTEDFGPGGALDTLPPEPAIHALTPRANWTAHQRKMMKRANRVKGILWSAVLAFLLLFGFAIQGAVNRIERQTGQQKLNLADGLAHLNQFESDPITRGFASDDTEPEEMDNIVLALKRDEVKSLQSIKTAAERASKGANWSTKARLAIVAMHLGDESLAAEMLSDRPEKTGQLWDPVQRTVFIKEFTEWSGVLEPLATTVADTENPALRSGICLAIGGVEKPGQLAKNAWKPILQDWYTQASDNGTHGAAGWVLSHWKLVWEWC